MRIIHDKSNAIQNGQTGDETVAEKLNTMFANITPADGKTTVTTTAEQAKPPPKKQKGKYNPETCQREPVSPTWGLLDKCPVCGGVWCLGLGRFTACKVRPGIEAPRRTTKGTYHIHGQYSPNSSTLAVAPKLPGEIPDLHLDVVKLSDVESKLVEWLWQNRFPVGMLTLLAGQPGVGKSWLTQWLAMMVTTGRYWPDNSGPAPMGEVIILSSEDSLEHTIRPRLDALGADCGKIFFVRGVSIPDGKGNKQERAVRLDLDIAQIDALLQLHPEVKLVVIDPISEYLGKIDSHKNAEVRAVTTPLAALAERYGVAIVSVTHFSKAAGGQALYRAMGSLAFTAQARAAWACIPDSEDQDRVLFLPLKMNIAKRPPGLAYSIVDGRLEWQEGDVDTTADEALANLNQPHKRDKLAEAVAWLKQRLGDGQPVESDALQKEAEDVGIAFATYRRAKDELKADGLKSEKGKGNSRSKWFVRLEVEQLEPIGFLEPLEPLEHLVQEAQEAQGVQEDQEDQEAHSLSDNWTEGIS